MKKDRMVFLWLIFAFGLPLVWSQDCECGIKGPSSRIVGGKEAVRNEFPWHVALMGIIPSDLINSPPFCGGSLISSEWILTAAHCVNLLQLASYQAVLGVNSLSDIDSTNTHSLSDVIIHEDFNALTNNNDIALLRLAEPVNFTNSVSPVCLPFMQQNLLNDGDTVTITGFGQSGVLPISSPNLMKAHVPFLSTSSCQRFPILHGPRITSNMICAGDTGEGSCLFDDGGPLVKDDEMGMNFQFGIDSFRTGCGLPNLPGVYTKVVNYLDWITTMTGAAFCKVGDSE